MQILAPTVPTLFLILLGWVELLRTIGAKIKYLTGNGLLSLKGRYRPFYPLSRTIEKFGEPSFSICMQFGEECKIINIFFFIKGSPCL